MTEETCPNGCDLATFGTHAGPPDCDLLPADPEAVLLTGVVYDDNGTPRRVEVAVPSGPTAEAIRERLMHGLSVAFRSEARPRPGSLT